MLFIARNVALNEQDLFTSMLCLCCMESRERQRCKWNFERKLKLSLGSRIYLLYINACKLYSLRWSFLNFKKFYGPLCASTVILF
jgi:hypothetical protein